MKTEYREWIAGRLKTLRSEAKLKQGAVATLLNMKQGTYGTYEQGTAEPSIFVLKQICEIYHITIDQFMQGSPNPKEITTTPSES